MTTTPARGRFPLLVTGAGGSLATQLRPRLARAGWELRGVDRFPGHDAEITELDVLDHAALDAATVGCGGVLHLAGTASEAPLAEVLQANVQCAHAVLDAALRRGIQRVVLAGSHHAVGFWERAPDRDLAVDVRARPDTFYGVSMVAVEALGQLYADRFGLEVVSLRLGSCRARPRTEGELATWLSPHDAARLVIAALTGPVRGHVVAYGVSANTRGWFDLTTARALGYAPADDAEVYADTVPATGLQRPPRSGLSPPPAPERAGGPFTSMPLGGLLPPHPG